MKIKIEVVERGGWWQVKGLRPAPFEQLPGRGRGSLEHLLETFATRSR